MSAIELSREEAIDYLVDRLFERVDNKRQEELRITFRNCDNKVLKSFLKVLSEFKNKDIIFITELEEKVKRV